MMDEAPPRDAKDAVNIGFSGDRITIIGYVPTGGNRAISLPTP
jgi:hypothetical protein